MNPDTATGRQPGRWLYVFPLLLLVGAGWSATVQGTTRTTGGYEAARSDTDQYGPRRFRLAGAAAIVDTATGITRNVGLGDVGTLAERFAEADSAVGPPLPTAIESLRVLSSARPVRLRAEAMEVDAEVVPIGVDESRAIRVPTRIDVGGWWSGGSVPGEQGPTVIVAHRDSKDAVGLFSKLGDLAAGDLVDVERADGATFVYRVDSIERLKKTKFPTERVYGPTSASTLRLITCGGKFDRSTGHYVDNVIVYGSFASIRGSEFAAPWLVVPSTGWLPSAETIGALASALDTPSTLPSTSTTSATLPSTSTTSATLPAATLPATTTATTNSTTTTSATATTTTTTVVVEATVSTAPQTTVTVATVPVSMTASQPSIVTEPAPETTSPSPESLARTPQGTANTE